MNFVTNGGKSNNFPHQSSPDITHVTVLALGTSALHCPFVDFILECHLICN